MNNVDNPTLAHEIDSVSVLAAKQLNDHNQNATNVIMTEAEEDWDSSPQVINPTKAPVRNKETIVNRLPPIEQGKPNQNILNNKQSKNYDNSSKSHSNNNNNKKSYNQYNSSYYERKKYYNEYNDNYNEIKNKRTSYVYMKNNDLIIGSQNARANGQNIAVMNARSAIYLGNVTPGTHFKTVQNMLNLMNINYSELYQLNNRHGYFQSYYFEVPNNKINFVFDSKNWQKGLVVRKFV